MGNYIQKIIKQPARLYHFSDAIFIYIEPNSNPNAMPEELVMRIQRMADEFIFNCTQDKMADKLRIGMTEFPFLPRAITSINDNQLIEILLLATSAARHISKKEGGRQWVHLKAIDSAPAASFANQNLRQACLQGIANGLIRVTSSTKNKIDWHIFDEPKSSNLSPQPFASTCATLV